MTQRKHLKQKTVWMNVSRERWSFICRMTIDMHIALKDKIFAMNHALHVTLVEIFAFYAKKVLLNQLTISFFASTQQGNQFR